MAKKGILFHICTVVVLALAVLAVYANSLHGQFVFDDSRIYNNSHLRITSLDWGSLREVVLKSKPATRPVANISFALNYYLHGYAVQGYHLVNILIHLCTGLLLYWLVLVTLPLLPSRQRWRPVADSDQPYQWLAFFAALLWLLHPLQSQSVAYLVQRMNSLAALFYLLSLLLYVKGRLQAHRTRSLLLFGASLVAGLLALGSKETSATLPFFILLYEWYFLQDLKTDWLRRNLPLLAGVAGVLVLLGLFFLGAEPLTNILAGYGGREFTLPQRLLTELRVVFFYLGLLLFPAPGRLNLDHDVLVSTSLLQPPTTLLAAMGLVALLGLAGWSARKHRLLSFAIFWFLGNLVIESSVIGLELVFEHRLYLPAMFLFVVVVVEVGRRLPVRLLKAGVALAVVLALLSGYWTMERNRVWHDRISLWSDCAEKSPGKARPKNNLGVALKKAGRLQEAATQFRAVIALDPTFIEAYNNLANIMVTLGRSDEALTLYYKALDIDGRRPVIHNNIGRLMLDRRRYDRAMMHFAEALRLRPDYQEARANLQAAQWLWRKSSASGKENNR